MDPEPETTEVQDEAWLVAYRAEGFGKGHAARTGERTARCGAWVKPPVPPLALPFDPAVVAPSRCRRCAELLLADRAKAPDGCAGSGGHGGFTE